MFKKIVLVCLLLGVGGTANAVEPKENGFYIGAAGGASVFEDDGAFSGFGFDDEDNSLQIHAGYKFFKHFAVEARYVDLGSFTLGVVNSAVEFKATSIHAVGMFPFGKSGWEIFGQFGFGTLDVDLQGSGTIEDGGVVGGGFGVRFHPAQNVSIGVQTDVYVWEDSGLYDMGVGGTQLSINVIF